MKEKINEAGKTNFDELSEKPMDGSEMEISLLGIAAEVRPTKTAVNEQTSKKYRINEETGEKTRL